MTTFLYILTSTESDNYYEQFLLSLTSLRMKMPEYTLHRSRTTKPKKR